MVWLEDMKTSISYMLRLTVYACMCMNVCFNCHDVVIPSHSFVHSGYEY
jgi:hypothetical protein